MRLFSGAVLILPVMLVATTSTWAIDFNGAWATEAPVCIKVFQKKADKVSIAPDAELYGGGFIVEGNRVTGTFQNCSIKSRHEDGANIHFIAACSTGVMVQEGRIEVKVVNDNHPLQANEWVILDQF
jgi:hypothetical protein